MKNIYYLLILCGTFSFAQQLTVTQKNISKPFFSSLFGKKKNSPFQPFHQKIPPADFTIYNKTTGLNDNYTLYNDEYKASLSNPVLVNDFRGSKVDSLNPSGSDTIGGALFVGFFNFLFQKQ